MKKSVLVIDDEADLCILIKIVLGKEGFAVDHACNLAEASLKLAKKPDIIFLDNNLPDGTGLAYLQMNPVKFMDSYIIMISADVGEELQEKARITGIGDFLSKPFSIANVKEILKRVA